MINKRTILLASLSLLCLEIYSNDSFDYSSRDDVKEYIDEISNKHGFESDKLLKLLGSAVYQEKVVRIMNRQPEGTMTWSRYKEMMVSDSRISAGEEFIKLYKEDLKKAEDLYGVPAEIIASIIGIETRYGRITGNIRVLDSLMTLSFNYPRRSKFFKVQLEEFLLLSREEGFNPESLEGSIAGAMGYGQFMPDSYRKYAVDFDSDGFRDLKKVIIKSRKLLKINGKLILEIGHKQKNQCLRILKENGYYINQLSKDFSGKDRCIVSTRLQ